MKEKTIMNLNDLTEEQKAKARAYNVEKGREGPVPRGKDWLWNSTI